MMHTITRGGLGPQNKTCHSTCRHLSRSPELTLPQLSTTDANNACKHRSRPWLVDLGLEYLPTTDARIWTRCRTQSLIAPVAVGIRAGPAPPWQPQSSISYGSPTLQFTQLHSSCSGQPASGAVRSVAVYQAGGVQCSVVSGSCVSTHWGSWACGGQVGLLGGGSSFRADTAVPL